MPPKIDLTGQVFGKWTALEGISVEGKNRPYYVCLCECGTKRVVKGAILSAGGSQSCGCWKKEKLSVRTRKHGLSRINKPIYDAWFQLNKRCYDSNHPQYQDYGGRGIRVCDAWRDDFPAFYTWALANGWKSGLSIDRYPNNDGNYEPLNCRWATDGQQQRNRRVSKTYVFFGEEWHIGEIAETFGLNPRRIAGRIYHGWNIIESVFGKQKMDIWV